MRYFPSVVLFVATGWLHAAEPAYPARPVRLLVPHAPDGPADIMSRVVGQRLAALGFEFAPNAPQQFGEYLKVEVAKWGKVVKDSGAKVD